MKNNKSVYWIQNEKGKFSKRLEVRLNYRCIRNPDKKLISHQIRYPYLQLLALSVLMCSPNSFTNLVNVCLCIKVTDNKISAHTRN